MHAIAVHGGAGKLSPDDLTPEGASAFRRGLESALIAGFRPAVKPAGLFLTLPLVSVGVFALLSGNPFNMIVFFTSTTTTSQSSSLAAPTGAAAT